MCVLGFIAGWSVLHSEVAEQFTSCLLIHQVAMVGGPREDAI